MRILWITNIPIGKHCEVTKTSPTSGGWMTALIEMFLGNGAFEICLATTWPLKEKVIIKEFNIEYVVLPGGYPLLYDYKKESNRNEWKKLISQFKPDIVHIHGTEYSHGFALMKACPHEKYLVSIQGLCGIIERYYYAGIDISQIIKNITLRDILRRDTMFQARNKMLSRGVIEMQYLKTTQHVIGRTTWDFIHSKEINDKIQYHFCNENLRSAFYNKSWQLEKIERHSIFLSQSEYSIKGFHIVLKAVSLLKKEFNDIQLIIAGTDITKSDSFFAKQRLTGYARYLRNLIRDNSLQKNVFFTESLDAGQMAYRYQHSHVFICPSSIENSPNSLGEAQIIGTPCIASYVGGIPDMIKDGESGLLYRFEEYEMLAYHIKRIFADDHFAISLSEGGKLVASERHDREKNINRLIEIYREIYNDKRY